MGALETEVLSALWSVPDGGTPREVCEAMRTDLAYTTVMTILSRLWQKGLADRTREGRAFRYRPLLSEAELAAQRMRALLTSAGDRKAALSQFVDSLTARDARVLRRALDDLDREK
jgi:predicted transcriptional regulator